MAPCLQRQITCTGTSVTHALSETYAPSPKFPSQACHRGGRVGPRPRPKVHAERYQSVSLTHTIRHDLRLLTLQIVLTIGHDVRHLTLQLSVTSRHDLQHVTLQMSLTSRHAAWCARSPHHCGSKPAHHVAPILHFLQQRWFAIMRKTANSHPMPWHFSLCQQTRDGAATIGAKTKYKLDLYRRYFPMALVSGSTHTS